MPAIRCQSCGKPNPDFLETCQYCDARLKPLTAPLTPPAPEAEAPSAKVQVIKCQSCGKPNPATVETCQFCDARLKPLTTELPPLPEAPSGRAIKCQSCGKPNPATLDTCQYCDARLTPATEELKAANARPAVTEWLVASREPTPSTPTTAWLHEKPANETQPPAEELPDWLRAPETPAAAVEPAAPTDMEEMPDWLRALRTSSPIVAAPPAQMPPAPAADVPDWMSSLREAAPSAPEPSAPAATPAEEEMPEWLRAMSAPAETPAAEPTPAADVPDWMSSLREAAPSAPEPSAPAPEATPAEEMPEWLRAMSAPTETPAAEPTPAADVPDWMSSLREAAPTETPVAELTPAADVPDWMSSLREAAPAEAPAEEESEPVILHPDEEESDAGDAWLQAMPATSGATPEWLGQLGVGPVDFEAPLDSKATPPAEEVPASPATDLPDWLTNLPSSAPAPAAEATPSAEPAAPLPADAPDWLRALREGAPAAATVAASQSAPPEASDLEQAALPNWVAAMRPVDVSAVEMTEEADTYEERVGVLAGMRGVLRAEPTVAQPHKSTVQVHKLAITPSQTQQAAMLSALVSEEAQPAAAPKRRRSFLPVIERWVVTLLLLAAIVSSLFALPADTFPLPDTIGLETQAAFDTIEALPAGQPVLLVFDYDPAHSGELNPGASAVAAHLARKGISLVALSPRVAGAAVADAVLNEAAAPVSYEYGTHYMNLGYLPGGPVGVAQVAANLRAAAPADFRGLFSDVWRSPALSAFDALEDFSAIIVIAAAPDGPRTWIEQAQPHAPGVKLLAVVSAAAEPLVRPYAEGNAPQLSGLVSGLIGAAKYEAQAGAGRATAEASVWQWDALGGGLGGAATLLLVGNLIFGVAGFVRRRRR